MTKPSRTCYGCDAPIVKLKTPTYKGREYCSSDCAIDAYETDPRTARKRASARVQQIIQEDRENR
jgi:hypothetical protein